jgi:hypothetical protein
MDKFSSDFLQMKEKVENFTGERGAAKRPLSAVRRGELAALATRPMKSAQLTAAPTMADFNALQADVKALMDALAQVSNALGTAKFL